MAYGPQGFPLNSRDTQVLVLNALDISADNDVGPSLCNLPVQLNSLDPTFRYRGYDCTVSSWPAWTYGQTLDIAGSGSDLSTQVQDVLLSSCDTTMKCNGGKYLISSSTTYGNLGTNALCFELVFRTSSSFASGYQHLINKRSPDSPYTGWEIATDTSGNLYFYMKNASAAKLLTTTALQTNCIYHALIFVDPSINATTGSQIYINGVALGSGTNFYGLGTCDNTIYMKSGANLNLTPNSLHINYMSLYLGNVGAKTDWDAIAKERFQKLTSIYTLVSGSPAATYARNSVAMMDKWVGSEIKFFQVSPGWPRWCQRKDVSGNLVTGLLVEPEQKNICQYGFKTDSWVRYHMNYTEYTDGSPLGKYGAFKDNDTSNQNRYIAVTTTETKQAGTKYKLTGYFKKGAWNYIQFVQYDSTNVLVVFNLDTGTVGTTESGQIDAKWIRDMGNGWYECNFIHTQITSNVYAIAVFPVAKDTTNNFYVGVTDQVKFYMAGVQCIPVASATSTNFNSFIPISSTSSITRYGDNLHWSVSNITKRHGSLSCNVLIENYNVPASGYILELNDNTVNNRMSLVNHVANDVAYIICVNNAVITGEVKGTTNIADGNKHHLNFSWNKDNFRLYVDKTIDGTPDTSGNPVTGLTYLRTAYNTGSFQFTGLLFNVRLYATSGRKS